MRTNPSPALPFRVLPVADRVEEEILSRARASGGAALGVGLLTVRDLERRLFAAAGLAPIDPLAAELLVGEVAPAAAAGTCFAGVSGEAGFARAFLSAWDGLREGGCGRAELAQLARRVTGLTARRLAGIERIATAYERACEERGLIDMAGARLALLDRLEVMELPADLARAEGIEVEDLVSLPVVRVRFLAALARRGLRVIYRLPAFEGRPGLAASLEMLQRPLEGEGRGIEVAPKAYGGGALEAFQRRLFDPDLPPVAEAPVQLVQGDDPDAELRAVVATVREKLRAGISPDDLFVAARGLPAVRQRMVTAFDAAGIPWRDRRGQAAAEAPPVAVALQLLRAAERAYPREELCAVLLSRYVAGGIADEAGYVPPREVARLLREAASRDDRGEGHAGRLRAHAERLLASGERRGEQAARAAEHLGAFLGQVRMEEQATLVAHAQRFAAGLEAIGLHGRSRAAEEREEGFGAIDVAAARAVARDQAALRALSAALASVAGAARRAGLADRQVELSRFRDLLETALGQTSLPARGARGGAVRLLDVSELPGRSCAHLVLCNVIDGSFPARKSSEPLLDEADREAIGAAAGRQIFRWHAAEEPLLFALAVAAARESLTLTASHLDEAGKESVRSPFFAEALAAAGIEEPVRERAAIVPPATRCASPGDLLARAALLAAGAAPAPGDVGAEAVREAAGADPVAAAVHAGASAYGGAGRVGRISSPAALAAIEARLRRGTERFGENVAWAASVSALESFAGCPYRFFAGRILSLPEPEAAGDELDAREGGTLQHEVVADVFAALRDEGLLPLRGGAAGEREEQVALAAAERALDRWQQRERTGPAALWTLRREQVAGAVCRLLESERRRGSELVPSEFEAPFGDEGADALFLPSPDGRERIAVRGRVDRVDRAPDGTAVEVIDYKSGKVDQKVDAAEIGRSSFQLPIYAVWALQHTGAPHVDAGLRSLRDGGTSKTLRQACEKVQVPLEALLELDPDRRAAARNGEKVEAAPGAGALPVDGDPNVADAAWAFLYAMRAGRFDVRPHGGPGPKKGCSFCRFATVCRVDGGVGGDE
ncbi:PD-(D/E)XK nuclease family protein [Vulgatibacter sp.]|uniref:PD-(D/E)XK nuclease family protein n=1 Tax=Vulgatibacter sp. TaxID=1971226 RepID=UPI0035641F16